MTGAGRRPRGRVGGEGAGGADDDIVEIRIQVPSECAGWRLDHFLKRRIVRLSRTRIQRIIATQIFMPDGRRARPSSGVRGGEVILLRRPLPVEPDVPRTFGVLYEDDDVLVIDKPAGLPMHTTAKFYRNTLVALLRERYPGQKLDLSHRIDRETSGVLLISRHSEAASFLTQAFARRDVSKTYLAIVRGIPTVAEGVIDVPLRLLDTPTHIKMGPAAAGQPGALPAVTRYRVVTASSGCALVAASPETGRQHQIRVHMEALGHPILGDKLYGAPDREAAFMAYCDGGMTPSLLALFDGLARHALHAHRLTFPHPRTRQPFTVESPLPADLQAALARPAPPPTGGAAT